jgi:hypothetical protein
MTAGPANPLAAVLDQLAAHREHIERLDRREADHHECTTSRLAEAAELVTAIRSTLHDHHTALAKLSELERQIKDLAAQPGGPGHGGTEPGGYEPGPAPRWWKLTTAERQEQVARLRAWVDQVYRPGYGALAAALGPCWESHDLCLYALDLLAELWSVLYLTDKRTPALLTAQAEYQARILPTLAEQLQAETSRCGHARARSHANGHARSMT